MKPYSNGSAAVIKNLLFLGLPYRWRILLGIMMVLTGTALSLLYPVGIRIVLDIAVTHTDVVRLQIFSMLLLLAFVARIFIGFAGNYLLDSTGQRVTSDLRKRLLEHILRLDLSFFHDQKVGDLISRLNLDAIVIKDIVAGSLVSLLNQLFMLFGSAAIMFSMNLRLTILLLLLAPMATFLSHKFGPIIRALSAQIQQDTAKAVAVSQEAMSGIVLVKTCFHVEHESKKYGTAIEKLLSTTLNSIRFNIWFQIFIGLLTSLTTVGIFWYGGMQVYEHKITAGQLVAFLFYTQNITQAFAAIAQLYGNLSQTVGASSRVFEILAMKPSITDKNSKSIMPSECNGDIKFENVNFAYKHGRIVLNKLNLNVSSGEIVAIVGKSGAGKTTAIQLLMRFYDVTEGSILINEVDIRDLSIPWVRRHISLVSQDVFLFGASVRENIRYGRLNASDDEVEDAARAASAHNFIETLEHGYETEVGERGVKLSGGQRQRLALARALLGNPKILILDEATSGVDSGTEKSIRDVIYEWNQRSGLTIIIVAHRLSTVRMVHRVIVLDGGQVSEQGRPHDLLQTDSEFCKLMEAGVFDGKLEHINAVP